jgi:sarcosine oxidase subunit alpha
LRLAAAIDHRHDLIYKNGMQPASPFHITVNGRQIRVTGSTSVAAAMIAANQACRLSVRGEPRAPLCGMGICMECRATVNGTPHRRTCQLLCTPEMEVVTE